MGSDPVEAEDVKELAKGILPETVIVLVAYGVFKFLYLHDPEFQSILQQNALLRQLTAVAEVIAVVCLLIVVFLWGFVAYMGLQYLKDRGEASGS